MEAHLQSSPLSPLSFFRLSSFFLPFILSSPLLAESASSYSFIVLLASGKADHRLQRLMTCECQNRTSSLMEQSLESPVCKCKETSSQPGLRSFFSLRPVFCRRSDFFCFPCLN